MTPSSAKTKTSASANANASSSSSSSSTPPSPYPHGKTTAVAAAVVVVIEHVRIPCRHGLAAARDALERAVPLLDDGTSFFRRRPGRPRGDEEEEEEEEEAATSHGRRARALAALPPLSRFHRGPRDLGSLVRPPPPHPGAAGVGVGDVLQYEIGNPRTAARMLQRVPGVALYTPVRVLLWEYAATMTTSGHGGDDGSNARNARSAFFEFDRPASTMGQFGDPEVDRIAAELDRDLTDVLVVAAGWEWFGQWERGRSRL